MVLALAGGSLIFLAFIVLFFFILVYGYYTKRGSGINQRPTDSRGESPGADGASEISTAGDEGSQRTVGTHGTK